jgi:hypothetical protein
MVMGPGLVKDKIVTARVAIETATCALSNAVAAPDKIWGTGSHVVPDKIYPSLQSWDTGSHVVPDKVYPSLQA